MALAPDYEKQFRANRKAWAWFEAMPPSYRRPATWWVMSAKKEETRERRLATLIADSAAGRKIKPLTPTGTGSDAIADRCTGRLTPCAW